MSHGYSGCPMVVGASKGRSYVAEVERSPQNEHYSGLGAGQPSLFGVISICSRTICFSACRAADYGARPRCRHQTRPDHVCRINCASACRRLPCVMAGTVCASGGVTECCGVTAGGLTKVAGCERRGFGLQARIWPAIQPVPVHPLFCEPGQLIIGGRKGLGWGAGAQGFAVVPLGLGITVSAGRQG